MAPPIIIRQPFKRGLAPCIAEDGCDGKNPAVMKYTWKFLKGGGPNRLLRDPLTLTLA